MTCELRRVQVIPAARDEVFGFFAEARNLEKITPGFLRFRITTAAPSVHSGAVLEYALRLHAVPVRWRTVIESFEPPTGFVDRQIVGPYRSWRHVHRFWEHPDGTEMVDIVHYELPLAWAWPLSAGVARVVRRDLDRIFDYRRQLVEETFAGGQTPSALPSTQQ